MLPRSNQGVRGSTPEYGDLPRSTGIHPGVRGSTLNCIPYTRTPKGVWKTTLGKYPYTLDWARITNLFLNKPNNYGSYVKSKVFYALRIYHLHKSYEKLFGICKNWWIKQPSLYNKANLKLIFIFLIFFFNLRRLLCKQINRQIFFILCIWCFWPPKKVLKIENP